MFASQFNWDVLTFDEAVARHGMLRESLEKLLPKKLRKCKCGAVMPDEG